MQLLFSLNDPPTRLVRRDPESLATTQTSPNSSKETKKTRLSERKVYCGSLGMFRPAAITRTDEVPVAFAVFLCYLIVHFG